MVDLSEILQTEKRNNLILLKQKWGSGIDRIETKSKKTIEKLFVVKVKIVKRKKYVSHHMV